MLPGAVRRRHARIAAAVRRGGSVRDVARRSRVHPHTVYKACRLVGIRFGHDGQGGDRAKSGALHRAMAEAARKGEPAAAIGKRMGYSEMTVRYASAKHGVRPVSGVDSWHERSLRARKAMAKRFKGKREDQLPGRTERTRRVLWLLLARDWTMQRIAKECGITVGRVSEIWRGVVRRNG